ncbi:neuromedin-U receptor 2 isoform X3 [Antechinus flavipes]|uniref:neuromedin-U receptor 2 isoform X3 n=1 Tax=Antechinus flavipes TaxID=38775 RepID=UPI002235D119|nr:neuromedin-U receptor 2 isoform X3 [Antechinus flavipes]
MDDIKNSSWSYQLIPEDPYRKYWNSTEDYLTFFCGPRRSHLFLPMTVVYTLIFVVGVTGNLLVCLVILKHQTMKTPTNYYLFSLAISDLLVLLFGMPLEIYEMWYNYPFLFGPVGCYFKTALFETVCFASILSVTTVSVERYVAILHPFRAKLESTRRRALRILVILWVFSILFSLPNTGIHGIKVYHFPNGTLIPESAICTVVRPMWIYNFIIQLRGDQSLEAEEMAATVQRPSRKSVTKMLFILVLVFAICWTPFHIDRLFFSFVEEWTESLASVFNLIHVISGVFFYLSSAVNPIIYNLLSHRFRAAFVNVISPLCKHWHAKHSLSGHSAHQDLPSCVLHQECHLVNEDVDSTFSHKTSIHSSHLSTML